MPTLYSSLAQSVEHMTVNHGVVGSSPTGGAKYGNAVTMCGGITYKIGPLAQLVRATGS